jgi:hypothetical protein
MTLREMLDLPTEFIAWFTWDGNLEYLCRQDVAFAEHKYLLPAWDSHYAKGSYASNRLILKEW